MRIISLITSCLFIGIILGLLLSRIFFSQTEEDIVLDDVVPQTEVLVQRRVPKFEDASSISVKNMHLTESESGQKKWELWSKQVGFDETTGIAFFKDPKLHFFVNEKNDYFETTALLGEVNQENGNLVLWNEVKGDYQGLEIFSEYLNYYNVIKKGYFHGNALAKQDSLTIEGKLFEIDVAAEKIYVTGDVVAEILRVSDGEKNPIIIKAPRLIYEIKNSQIVFLDKVQTVQGERVIDSEKLTIYLKKVKKKQVLSKIIAKGSVNFKDGEGTLGTGEILTYYPKNEYLLLKGDPVLTKGDNIIRGDIIKHFLETNRSEVISTSKESEVEAIFVPGEGLRRLD